MSENQIIPEKIERWRLSLAKEISIQSKQYELANLRYDAPLDAIEYAVRSTNNKQIGFTGLLIIDMLEGTSLDIVASIIISNCNKVVGIE